MCCVEQTNYQALGALDIAQEIEGEASFEPVCLALAIFLLCILSDVLIPIFLDASSLFVNITTGTCFIPYLIFVFASNYTLKFAGSS